MKTDIEAIKAKVETCVGFISDCPEGSHSDAQELMSELVTLVEQKQAELERLRAGGCARDQRTTQFCAEAVALQRQVDRLENGLRLILTAHSRGFDIHYAMGVAEEALRKY